MHQQPKNLGDQYWSNRYQNDDAPWDTGCVSPPLKGYIDQLTDKNIAILIPGCGNAYEAEYLLQQGFTNITLIDISASLVDQLKEKFASQSEYIHIVHTDFFNYHAQFDLILEQTFFSALDPSLRKNYAEKMYNLLKHGGKLAGVLFDKIFESGPPFSGSKAEYEKLFSLKFSIVNMIACYNSVAPRAGAELFFILQKF